MSDMQQEGGTGVVSREQGLDSQDLTELLELVSVARGEEIGRMMVAGTDMNSPTTRLINLTGLEYKLIVMKAAL